MLHTWIGQDEDYVSCLTCGSLVRDVGEGVVMETEPDIGPCTSDTRMVHGYERYCHDCDSNECAHTNHTCECLQCA